MRETAPRTLRGLPETLLIPLYARARESLRPDALIVDEKAVALVTQSSFDVTRASRVARHESLNAMRMMQTREFDRRARDFLARHPAGVVVHLGCGLDTRYGRVCTGHPEVSQPEWYDLDLPEVIRLRRELIGEEGGGYHLLGCSMFEEAWLDAMSAHRRRPILVLAESVLVYFEEAQIRSLVEALLDHLPGSELVFDAFSPFGVWECNLAISRSRLTARAHWGIRAAREIEGWGAGIRLLDEWGVFDRPEPRLAHLRWMAPFDRVLRPVRILHYRLGETPQ